MKIRVLVTLVFTSAIYERNFSQIINSILDVNNLHIPVNSTGHIGFVEDFDGFSEAPAGSGVSIMTSAALWVAGKNEAFGLFKGFFPGYLNTTDLLKPGPVYFGFLVPYDSSVLSSKYNRVWKITNQQIEYHKENYYKNNYVVPEVILNWPGNGDTSLGMAKVLAAFVDYNSNEIYEPLLGDHPNIKGDEAIFVMYNDRTGDDNDFDSEKMEAEVHLMLYAYDEPPNTVLGNTVFMSYSIYNRSNQLAERCCAVCKII
jgi:hypothetical protein